MSAGISTPHESAVAQVAGAVHYIDDLPDVRGTLHAAPILSTQAHGKLLGVDATAALAVPGVVDVILAKDIPGDPMLAAFAGDEPVFAMDTVQFVGQVVGVVVATTVMQARRAARKVQLHITPLPAILTVQQAMAAQSFVLPPVHVRRAVGAGVHAGALAHRLQPFQDAEGGFVVLLGSVLLASHAAGPFGFTKGARIAEAGAVCMFRPRRAQALPSMRPPPTARVWPSAS